MEGEELRIGAPISEESCKASKELERDTMEELLNNDGIPQLQKIHEGFVRDSKASL